MDIDMDMRIWTSMGKGLEAGLSLFDTEALWDDEEVLLAGAENVENQPECIGRLSVHSASPRSTGS